MLSTICYFLCLSGIPWLIREIYARRKVTIINYHNPEPHVFEEHVKYYARCYSFVSIDQVVDALENKSLSSLPSKPLLITFDDAHAGNALLFPILKKYNIPAVIYAVAGVINTNRKFWFDKLSHHGEAMKRLKEMPDKERRICLLHEYNHFDEKEYEGVASSLSAEQLKYFMKIGGKIGSHTMFHPILDRCEEKIGLEECRKSRECLEKLTGNPVEHFAVPNGNINETVLTWVRKAGYRSCRTISPGWVTSDTSPFMLPNLGVNDKGTLCMAVLQSCGMWSAIKNVITIH